MQFFIHGKGHKDHRVRKDHKVRMVHKDNKAHKRVRKDRRVHKRVRKTVHKDHRVRTVHKDHKVRTVHKAHRVHTVHKDHKVRTVHKDNKVRTKAFCTDYSRTHLGYKASDSIDLGSKGWSFCRKWSWRSDTHILMDNTTGLVL
jgi:hypothetical protein